MGARGATGAHVNRDIWAENIPLIHGRTRVVIADLGQSKVCGHEWRECAGGDCVLVDFARARVHSSLLLWPLWVLVFVLSHRGRARSTVCATCLACVRLCYIDKHVRVLQVYLVFGIGVHGRIVEQLDPVAGGGNTAGPGHTEYLAPEARSAAYSEKLGVYSFAVLLVEMCPREAPDRARRDPAGARAYARAADGGPHQRRPRGGHAKYIVFHTH